MAYRWKNYGTPIEAERAQLMAEQAQQMQGYRPNYAGRSPFDISPEPTKYDVVDAGAYGGLLRSGNIEDQQAYANNQIAQQDASLKNQIVQLETELAQIDAQIAEIEKTLPSGVSDAEWEIAAKRAEIGDNSAYDNLVSRGYNQMATARSVEDNIKNELYNAEKLTWGLKVKSDEDREMARNQIAVSLRKAEDMAAKYGMQLPEGYYRLKTALENDGSKPDVPNFREFINEFKHLQAQGKLTRAKREEANELAKKYNSEYADELRQLYANSKGKTVEDGNDRKAAKKRADAFYDKVKNLSAEKVKEEWDKLTSKERDNIKNHYKVTQKENKAFISSK